MKKLPFTNYTPNNNGLRSVDEALSEVQREMDVRKRLFDRWVMEGRMSWVDAHDRLERHMSALKHLIAYDHLLQQASADDEGLTTTPHISLPISELDAQAEAAA